MGVNLRTFLPSKTIQLKELSGKVLAIDAYNALYQFLAIIRGVDGEPLRDSRGEITSHLSGLFYRSSNLLEMGVRPVYVFDGTPPSLKEMEVKRRSKLREEAMVKYEEALRKGDLEKARTFAQATATLKDRMVEDSKRLLGLMGIPWVQAPSEGEAQAAHMAKKGHVWAVASQDYDSLLFGALRLVRNLAITGRRKLPKKPVYVKVLPELIELDEVLAELRITREQLIDICILVGTDFNPDGVKGFGPRTAWKLIQEYGSLERALPKLEAEFPADPSEIKRIFLEPEVTDSYHLTWDAPSEEGIVEFLCDEKDFSEERVRKAVGKAVEGTEKLSKRPELKSFF